MNLFRLVFILLGTISLCIGIIAIAIPGLPTTPFLLLSAGLYVKGSDKLYAKLITNRIVGSYISEFSHSKGMTMKSKLFAIATMWVMIALSCICFIDSLLIILIVLALGIMGTIVMGFMVKTVMASNNNDK
jgi:uncharacterized protein